MLASVIPGVGLPSIAFAQLNQNCVVAVLNRSVSVNPDGTWVLPNIPANFGQIRARATCVNNGVTTFGQSAFFSIPANGNANVPPLVLGSTTPIPTAITITSPVKILTSAGATTQLQVTATYGGGSNQDITPASAGTQYTISNPGIATIAANGLVTAVSNGTVAVQAVNEGAQGIISIQVAVAGASHGGIPDAWAIANGLDPNDPAMPSEDPDHDGLTNLQEFQNGTDPHNPDTDGDGLTDGQEVLIYRTNALVLSTDGTGIPDGVEVESGTIGGTLAQKLAKSLSSLEVKPNKFVLTVNSIEGQASQQLSVIGHLIDGKTTINLTTTQKGTTFASSDVTVCNFGAPDGNVFAGTPGTCTIKVTNGAFAATAMGTVTVPFTPKSLSFVTIPGFANSVSVNGNFAYVAAGSAGLQVVDVTDRTNPRIVASLSLPGNANDVRLLGNLALVAGGTAGLHAVDIAAPLSPFLLGTLSTSGETLDLVVQGSTAFIANGMNLFLANISNPRAMARIATLALPGTIEGVDIDSQRKLAVVAAGTSGIHVVDVSNPAAPLKLGTISTGNAVDVAIQGSFAFVGDYLNSTVSVDLTTPSAPVVRSNITDANLGGFLQDIVVNGQFALGADVKFVNGIPITDITDPTHLQARAILSFPQRDDNGMGLAADGSYVYLATERNSVNKFGTVGDSRLYIGQYRALQDVRGVPPTVTITSPVTGGTVIEGATLPINVNAIDDVAVASVNFLVNGKSVFTATSAPYQFSITAPTGTSTLAIAATAVDFGGNIGTASTVVLNIIPDPLTRATGLAVDTAGIGLPGASVTCQGVNTSTDVTGAFSINGLPTIQGNIGCSASYGSGGNTLLGLSTSVPPVPGGTTDMGRITLSQSTSTGTDFWFAMQPSYGPSAISDAKVMIVTDTSATYSITIGGVSSSGHVTAALPAIVDLPRPPTVLSNQTVENMGIHLVTSSPTSVTVLFANSSTSESYLAIPTASLGTDYYATGYNGLGQSGQGPSLFTVVGTQANTSVTIVPACDSGANVTGKTVQISLGIGQTYQYMCNGAEDITGTRISSSAPVGVIAGAVCTNVPGGFGCNNLVEMMFPIATLYDTEFYTAPLPGVYRVVASQDGTVVTVSEGGSNHILNLSQGTFQQLQFSGGAHFTSNKPISVTQYAVGSSTLGVANPLQMQIVPLTHWRATQRFNTGVNPYFTYSPTYAVITAPAAAVGGVTLNGVVVSGFTALPGGEYQSAIIPVPAGQSVIRSPLPVAVYSLGYGVQSAGLGLSSYGAPVSF